ncbi:MAG: CBS domain-containing protein, partial [Gammaproteobacteria bacterium]|nr:CBS domain-containing protein [Gammaproteobacteria bacterium]
MTTDTALRPWEALVKLAEVGDTGRLEKYLTAIGPSEAFRALLRLSAEEQQRVLTTLSPEEAAELMEEIPEEHAADIIEQMDAKAAATILNEMESDEQADVLAEMEEEDAAAIVAEMDPEEAAEVVELIRYPHFSAGGLMMTEYFAYPETLSVGGALDDLSERAEEEAVGQEAHVYVVSTSGKLLGVLDLRDLVLTARSTPLSKVIKSPLYVSAETELDDLEEFFDRHDFHAVPVVDMRQRLIGMVRRSDVEEALTERADQDFMKSQGIVG